VAAFGGGPDQGTAERAESATVTFSSALSAVRRWLWIRWVFARVGHANAFSIATEDFRQLLLNPPGVRCLKLLQSYGLYLSLQKSS
jgi:hypothetical protein